MSTIKHRLERLEAAVKPKFDRAAYMREWWAKRLAAEKFAHECWLEQQKPHNNAQLTSAKEEAEMRELSDFRKRIERKEAG